MLGRKWNLRQEWSRAGAWRRQPPAAFQAGPCQPPVSLSVRGLVLARNPSERRSAVVVSPEGVHAGGGGAPAGRVGVEPERGGDAAVHVELHIESAATKSLGTRPPAFAVGSKAAPRDARVATSNSH
jgi:hypothetical protein